MYREAHELAAEGKADDAIKGLNRVINFDPDSKLGRLACMNLADTYYDRGFFREARELYADCGREQARGAFTVGEATHIQRRVQLLAKYEDRNGRPSDPFRP